MESASTLEQSNLSEGTPEPRNGNTPVSRGSLAEYVMQHNIPLLQQWLADNCSKPAAQATTTNAARYSYSSLDLDIVFPRTARATLLKFLVQQRDNAVQLVNHNTYSCLTNLAEHIYKDLLSAIIGIELLFATEGAMLHQFAAECERCDQLDNNLLKWTADLKCESEQNQSRPDKRFDFVEFDSARSSQREGFPYPLIDRTGAATSWERAFRQLTDSDSDIGTGVSEINTEEQSTQDSMEEVQANLDECDGNEPLLSENAS